MFGWLLRRRAKPGTTHTAPASLDQWRNAALAEFVLTWADEERLEAFLATAPAELRNELRASSHQAYDAAAEFLQSKVGLGRLDMEAFHRQLEGHLRRRIPWLDQTSLDRLRGYTSWYSWHEGY